MPHFFWASLAGAFQTRKAGQKELSNFMVKLPAFTSKHHYMVVIGAGFLAGFYFANAPTGTGVYSTFIGQTAANIYVAGAKLGGGTAPAVASTPAPAATS